MRNFTAVGLAESWLLRMRAPAQQLRVSAAKALTRQEPFINQNLTDQALGMLLKAGFVIWLLGTLCACPFGLSNSVVSGCLVSF
jgi:hypothetical protein